MASLLNLSGSSLNPYKPYDYEVEYLESTGKQIIDLGFYATDNIAIEAEVYRGSNNVRLDFGAEEEWTRNIVRFVIIENTNAYYQYGKATGSRIMAPSSNLIGKLSVTVNKRQCNVRNIATGNTYTMTALSNESFVTPATFWLFGVNWLNRADTTQPENSGSRIYNFKVADTNVNMDLIPVVKNNIGCMYDKVSKQLFYGQGTDDFIVGQRV